jgi:hypothetical protein
MICSRGDAVSIGRSRCLLPKQAVYGVLEGGAVVSPRTGRLQTALNQVSAGVLYFLFCRARTKSAYSAVVSVSIYVESAMLELRTR